MYWRSSLQIGHASGAAAAGGNCAPQVTQKWVFALTKPPTPRSGAPCSNGRLHQGLHGVANFGYDDLSPHPQAGRHLSDTLPAPWKAWLRPVGVRAKALPACRERPFGDDVRSLGADLAGVDEAERCRVLEFILVLPEQRAVGPDDQIELLVEHLLWDCIPLVDDAIDAAIEAAGGIGTIAISHPHYYTGMVEWAARFEARVLLHERDREWITRSSARIELWSGDRCRISENLELVRLGGHFPGGTVCLWRAGAAGRGALLSGDIVQVVSDRDWVSFMWSYPNLVPLPGAEVERIAAVVATLEFDRIYGAWWDRVVAADAKVKVARSAARYLDALRRVRE